MRVTVQGMQVMLYPLAFFSKRDVAIAFWENARLNAPSQKRFV